MEYFKSFECEQNVLSVYIDPNTICQQHCWYCYVRPESFKEAKWNKIMPFSKMKKYFDALSHVKYLVDIDFIGGEPALSKDLTQILTYCSSIKNFRKIKVLSNGLKTLKQYTAISDKIEFELSFHIQTNCEKFINHAKELVGRSKFVIQVLYDGDDENFNNRINYLKRNNLLQYARMVIVESRRPDMPIHVKIPNSPLFNNLYDKEFELNGKWYSMIEIKEKHLNKFKGWKCYKSLIKIFVDGTILVSGSNPRTLTLDQLRNYTKFCDICENDYCKDENTMYFNYKEKD